MTYKIWGWYHPAGGHYVVRVRTLTEPLTEQLVAVYRRTIEEFMPEEFYMDPDAARVAHMRQQLRQRA